jgi:hypothetical protein
LTVKNKELLEQRDVKYQYVLRKNKELMHDANEIQKRLKEEKSKLINNWSQIRNALENPCKHQALNIVDNYSPIQSLRSSIASQGSIIVEHEEEKKSSTK